MFLLRTGYRCGFPNFLILLSAIAAPAADLALSTVEDSGGVLMSEQAAYDVRNYDIKLRINPADESISGSATVEVVVLDPLSSLVLDLDPRLTVRKVLLREPALKSPSRPAPFERRDGQLWITLPHTAVPSTRLAARIEYGGHPRAAKHAPWDGGFVWAKTPGGEPWIATAVQGEGADLWWPCKDHPSDEPESLTLRIRVPNPLVVAANGRLLKLIRHLDKTRTYIWHTDYPINNYGVALNIAPYQVLTTNYTSVAGDLVPACFWVLPENVDRARQLFPELLDHLNFYERLLGPYPFRGEKYGVAETPHLGMEHQTIIAYGNKYAGGPQGYDWLHHHELGHEWWGNLVTAADWRHFWLHEGLCTYMQALYSEERDGLPGYHRALNANRRTIRSQQALVPPEPLGMREVDQRLGLDVYYKGAWIIHTLRYLVGKDHVLALLRQFAYPNPELERRKDGAACRFVTTDEFVELASKITGQDLAWFFHLYLDQPRLPKLLAEVQGESLLLRWDIPPGFSFPMPIDVESGGQTERIPMPGGQARLDAHRYRECRFDPQRWILMDKASDARLPTPVP